MAINRLHLMNSILKLRLTDELQVQHLFKIMWLDISWWWIELHHHHHYTNKMLWPNWGLKNPLDKFYFLFFFLSSSFLPPNFNFSFSRASFVLNEEEEKVPHNDNMRKWSQNKLQNVLCHSRCAIIVWCYL